MSIGPTAPLYDAAGAPFAQTKGATIDRAANLAQAHARHAAGEDRSLAATRADSPSGETSVTDESAADGRRPWERAEPSRDPDGAPGPETSTLDNGPLGVGLDLTA